MLLMLIVVVCYTICSLSDKKVISTEKINGDEFGFFLAVSSIFFLLFYLPFADLHFTFNLKGMFFALLLGVCKIVEMKTSAAILTSLTAFEVKAWLGTGLFISYFYDIAFAGDSFKLSQIIFIIITVIGLFLIALRDKTADTNPDYKKIWFPLVLYILSKFFYGIILRVVTPYMSKTVALIIAMIVMAVILVFRINPIRSYKEKKKGVILVSATRLVNTIGSIAELYVIASSMVNYSFIQPLILIVLFFIKLIKKEQFSKSNLIASITCIIGIVGFQLAKTFM